jgi:hypothetical protein
MKNGFKPSGLEKYGMKLPKLNEIQNVLLKVDQSQNRFLSFVKE